MSASPDEPLRVLMVAPYGPSPIRVRPFQFLRALAARGHALTLVCPVHGSADAAALAALRPFCTTIPVAVGRTATVQNYLRALPSALPLQAAHSLSPTLVGAVRTALAGGTYTVVHIEHLRAAEVAWVATRDLAAPPPLVLDAVDSISLLFERTLRKNPALRPRVLALLDLARTKRYEAAYGRRFAHITLTSAEDRWAFTTLRTFFGEPPGTPITVVPNGVDTAYFQPTDEQREPATVIFAGKLSYHANEAAAFFLLRTVMPLVWRTHPTVRVVIAGANPSQRLKAHARDQRVTVTGYVPDLRPYLARASLAIAPLRYGVGVQNKVLEAMAMGTPVLAARQATVALAARPGSELLVADEAPDFAEAILALLASPARSAALGQAGRTYVERHHNWATSAALLEQCYRAAGAGRRK